MKGQEDHRMTEEELEGAAARLSRITALRARVAMLEEILGETLFSGWDELTIGERDRAQAALRGGEGRATPPLSGGEEALREVIAWSRRRAEDGNSYCMVPGKFVRLLCDAAERSLSPYECMKSALEEARDAMGRTREAKLPYGSINHAIGKVDAALSKARALSASGQGGKT